jgi:hypothetical protein
MRSLLLAIAAILLLASPAAATPAWLPPVDLGAETTSPPDSSSIGRAALGANGTAVAAWAQNVPGTGNWVLQVARRQPGQPYSGAITVPATTGVETLSVRVGVDGSGNATILYRLGGALAVVPWPAGSAAPGAKQPLEAGGSPQLAVGRGGTAVATWIDESNVNNPRVRAAVRPGPTGDFGASALISDFGNGMNSITGLEVAVGDGGHATVVWSRVTLVPNVTVVEVNDRAPGGDFSSMGLSISETVAPALSTEPAVAVDPAGRSTALWTRNGQIEYAEHAPGQPSWSGFQRASQVGATANTPVAAAAPSGAVIAAWVSNGAMEAAARPPGGGAFADFRTLSGPSMESFLPLIAVGGNGDAVIAWLVGDGKALFTVQRKANGAFGPLLTAVSDAGQPLGESRNFFEPSIGMDDEGNGAAAWTRDAFHTGASHYRFQSGSFDAAAPALSSSVPPGAQVRAPIGMAAAAADRVSPVSIAWNFGDGSTASGGAVSHAFGAAGAFNVTVTATDAAGNQASRTHPVLIAAAPPKRITSPVRVAWGVSKRKLFLLKMSVTRVPKGAKAALRCARHKSGKKCPFKRKSSKRIRKRTITLFKQVKVSKVARKKQRTFRAGQRLVLRITAPGYIGKAVRYDLRKSKIPSGKTFCMRVGSTKLRKRC